MWYLSLLGLPVLAFALAWWHHHRSTTALSSGVTNPKPSSPPPPSLSEQALVRELETKLLQNREASLRRLSSILTDQQLSQSIQRAQEKISDSIDSHRTRIQEELPQAINDRLYGLAVKSLVPRKAWRENFEQEVATAQQQLLQPDQIKSAFQQGIQQSADGLRKHLQKEVKATLSGFGTIQLSPESLTTLNRLKRQPERMKLVFAKHSHLQNIAQRHLQAAAIGGGTMIVSGMATRFLVDQFGPEIAFKIAFPALHWFLQTALGEMIRDWLVEWIAEEGFGHVLGEVMEAIGLIATGLGAVFAAWKIFRYGKIVKRLLVDKEPLQEMRSSIGESLFNSLRELEKMGHSEADQHLRNYWQTLQEEISRLKQEIRSHSYAAA